MSKFLLLLIILCTGLFSAAQVKPVTKLQVFLDCSGVSCDEDYIKSEIRIVDFVRNREEADIHLLITANYFGYWNQRYRVIFYGNRKNAGYSDTLSFDAKKEAPGSEKRLLIVQYIKAGLVPLLLKTPFINTFSIDMKNDTSGLTKTQTFDEWNNTVININGEGQFSADANYTSSSLNAAISLNQATRKNRFGVGLYFGDYKSVYKYEDSSGTKKYEVNNNSYGVYQFLVLGISNHFSIGYTGKYSASTFSNYKSLYYFHPIAEINLFKYTDINNRSIFLRYGPDVTYGQYEDTTIYNKKKELLYGHEASLSISFTQKWGSFSAGAYYRNYFVDTDLKSAGANVTFNIYLFGGLSVYASASGSIIHDQVYLPKGGASERDVLIRRRQLKSTFNYYTSGGINFRFGSKYSNIVNPRITGYRGF